MHNKTIIVPTDFSESAYSATIFASKLAEKKNYSLHLFHCYTSDSILFDEEKGNDALQTTVMKADLLMAELKENLSTLFPDLNIKTECVTGLLYEVLPQYAIAPNFSLIIMGTTGAGKNKSTFWGSNTSQISSKAHIPVIAIPQGHDALRFDKIAILSNFKAEELDTVREFTHTVSDISQLDVIHIYSDREKNDEINDELAHWTFNFKELNGIHEVKHFARFTEKNNKDLDTISEVINHTINENRYDIVLVTKTRKSFFERIFKTSISKEIALELKYPTFFDNK